MVRNYIAMHRVCETPLTVAELAVAVGLDRCAPRVSGARLTQQQIRVAAPKQFQEDLELVAGSLIHIQDNVVYLVHGTLRDFIRYNSSIFAQSKPPVHIQQPDAGQWGALCRSLAILSAPEIRDFKDMATQSRLYDHLCSVPISSQPYSFARYAGSSLVHDLKLANNGNTPEELTRAATDAVSEFWDTIETRSWWIETFTTLQREAAEEAKTPLQTSLHLAASVGIQSAVQKLLPEASDSFATIKMALCPAIRRGNIETTRLLLTTAPNFEEDIWRSAIEFSCIHGRAELLSSVLLWRSESTGRELSESELLTCLSHVAGRGHWHIIHALKDAYPHMMDSIKREEVVSLIEEAAFRGRDGVISELLPIVIPIVDSISNPAQPDNDTSALETEVYSGDASGQIEDSVRTEPDGAATDTTMEEAEGETVPEEISKVDRGNTDKDLGLGPAIIKAVGFGNAVAVHLLASISDAILEYRSEPTGMTPLHLAAAYGNTEALIELLNCGADIHSVDNQDATALLFASLQQYSDVARNINAVNALLKRGANPDHAATRSAKYRAVHFAARNGSAALVRVLLGAGASENARLEKPDWDTPLHLAVRSSRSSAHGEYVETVRALLEFGADVNASRGDGSTALHLAINGAELSKDMVRVLVKFGADIDKLDDDGRSPLHYAVSKQDGEVAKMLWNPSGFIKGSVMFNAAARGNAERVRQLLSAGCDKAEQDEWGRTAYDVSGSAEVRSLLAPPLATSGNSPGDDGEAAAVQTTEEEEFCPTPRQKEKLYLSWSCDMCKRKLKEEIFYHCCACSSDCEGPGTFDMCEKCFDTSDCKGEKHKIVMRFAAEGFTSYEEYSPGIAGFGHEVGDRNQEADTVETT